MEKEDVFLHTYFNHVSQLCFDKAKEHIVSDLIAASREDDLCQLPADVSGKGEGTE